MTSLERESQDGDGVFDVKLFVPEMTAPGYIASGDVDLHTTI